MVHSDGGGRVPAVINVIHGRDRVLRLFMGIRRKFAGEPLLLQTLTIDGLPGLVTLDGNGVLQATAVEIENGRITAIYAVRNPDKLRHVAAALADEQMDMRG
jgi:RNA polymerase sigma-70 factor (ECF subfamily)